MTSPANSDPLNIINKDEIHIWVSRSSYFSKPDIHVDFLSILSAEERKKYNRFVFDKDRLQYLHTRGLVRNALSYYESLISPKEWSFAIGKFGKPKTTNPNINNHLNFNVSHTSGVVTLAISKNKIGIDVENIDRELDFLRLARTFFSENEYQHLCNIDCNQQKKRYFDLWTLKEAYLKAKGVGLQEPLDAPMFSIRNNGVIDFFNGSDQSSRGGQAYEKNNDYSFLQFELNPHFVISLASDIQQPKPQLICYNPGHKKPICWIESHKSCHRNHIIIDQ